MTTSSRSGASRPNAVQVSPDGFNEDLTQAARDAIAALNKWRETTPDSPLPTQPAGIADPTPYVPRAVIPDGVHDLTPEEVKALYGGTLPTPEPDEVQQAINDLDARVDKLEHPDGKATASAKSTTKA